MGGTSRRDLIRIALTGAAATQVPLPAQAAGAPRKKMAYGIEGQRKADLGDGTFVNPIVAGDRPDPTVLKDGNDYYMTCVRSPIIDRALVASLVANMGTSGDCRGRGGGCQSVTC